MLAEHSKQVRALAESVRGGGRLRVQCGLWNPCPRRRREERSVPALAQGPCVLPHSLSPLPYTPGLEIYFPFSGEGFSFKPELSLTPSPRLTCR